MLARLRNCTAFSRQKTCLKLFFGRNNLRKKSRHLSFAHNMYIFIFTDYCDFIVYDINFTQDGDSAATWGQVQDY